ncbi:NADH:ubiquinone oxidoreductase subunit NDUFA12 [Roseinatronobacter alkalisoli]|uniref:NADH:ubiquinone oxidoreductase subunit NDUFA12 n=1 Tax=Roseinatronobacter alkalisoli TaxID=3028235 RepID=A0ABT5T8M2_9RHOB|nr:NADH:ubiquinone oxidoreductase subunit NDUFA12 [Roseinatronobacter sp. HJB301]MDD7971424.1 NADH:ubiquinone oxidoreductase subunit NDUFA12 [Roseinatronobacter sp. HJB301]
MKFLLRFVTWWNYSTLNTAFFTWRNGVKVGEDEQGNVFYRSHDGKKRWVMYNGESEASRIAPDWHGWLHHTWDELPDERPLVRKDWEKPHQENLTGTALAYAPKGSIRQAQPKARTDYEAWTPE